MKQLVLLCFGASVSLAQPQIQFVVNAGSLDTRLCAGGLAKVTGNGFSQTPDAESVMAGGRPAPIISADPGSALVQLATDLPSGMANMTITVQGDTSPGFAFRVLDYCPAFYAIDGVHFFFNSSNVPLTSSNPATPGKTVTVYMVGLGPTNPSFAAGLAPNVAAPTIATPILTIGNKPAQVSYAGLAMGKPGIYQVNFTVPPDAPPGDQQVMFQIGNQPAPSTMLTIASGASAIASVTNGATFQVKDLNHPAAPNSFVSIFASNLGSVDATQNLFPSTAFQGVSVAFNGKAAPLYYVFPSLGQINLVLPSELPESGTATMTINNSVGISQNFILSMSPTDIGVFRLTDPSNNARKNGAVLFANTAWRVIPASMATALGLTSCTGKTVTTICGQPAAIGDVIQIYFTGGGKATPDGNPALAPLPTGQLAPADGSVLYKTVQPITVRIGGLNAPVLFAGIAPGNAGLYQVNAMIPVGIQVGDDVPVIVASGGNSDTVTIAVR